MTTLSSTESLGVIWWGTFGYAALFLEVKQSGVILLVSLAAYIANEVEINVGVTRFRDSR